jgi:ribosome-associated protein
MGFVFRKKTDDARLAGPRCRVDHRESAGASEFRHPRQGVVIILPGAPNETGNVLPMSPVRPIAERFMIRINDTISIDDGEITESFIRSSGPGGQNVNKLATAVQLRFDVRHSPSLSHEVRARLERLAGKRLTRDGVLVITAQRHRTQERNRDDALERLVELIRAAAVRPTPRRATRPTLGSKVRRLEGKKRRAGVKALRQGKPVLE